MTLTFDSWDYKISSTNFDSESDLLKFVADCRPLMDQVTTNNNHDRFTYFIKFYQEYKSQTAPLLDFFESYDPKDDPTDDRPDCVGRALKLKTILGSAYPALKDKFYVTSCSIDYEDFNKKITTEMMENYHYLVNFSEHCILTLKFEVDGRTGFVLYEMSFLNDKPIVVMADNQKPSYGSVTLPKGRRARYVCLNENYVENSFDTEEGAVRSVTGVDDLTLALFVGGSFKRQDMSAKYCLQLNIQYSYAIRGGKLGANFSHYGASPVYNIQRWEETRDDYVKCKIPMDYFLQNDTNQEYEAEFKKIADIFGYQEDFLRNSFKEISKIQLDIDFVNQISELPLAVINSKMYYVKSVSKNIS